MVNPPNPFASSQRAILETAQDVSFKTLEGVAKLFELNLQATRTVIAESTDKLASKVNAGGQITDKQVVAAAQPSAQKVAAYTKHVYDIVSKTNADIVAVVRKHALTFTPQMLTAAARSGSATGSDAFRVAMTNPFGAAQKAIQQTIDTATKATTKAPAASRRVAAAAA